MVSILVYGNDAIWIYRHTFWLVCNRSWQATIYGLWAVKNCRQCLSNNIAASRNFSSGFHCGLFIYACIGNLLHFKTDKKRPNNARAARQSFS